jgi:hypothetical protein
MMLANLIPGVAQIRTTAYAIVTMALIGGGAWAGAWVRSLEEPARIAAAVKPMCDAAAAKAEAESLRKAVSQAEQSRVAAEDALELIKVQLLQQRTRNKELSDATPGRDSECVPAGAPWLLRRK